MSTGAGTVPTQEPGPHPSSRPGGGAPGGPQQDETPRPRLATHGAASQAGPRLFLHPLQVFPGVASTSTPGLEPGVRACFCGTQAQGLCGRDSVAPQCPLGCLSLAFGPEQVLGICSGATTSHHLLVNKGLLKAASRACGPVVPTATVEVRSAVQRGPGSLNIYHLALHRSFPAPWKR